MLTDQDKVYTQAHSVPIIYEVGLHLFLLTIIRSPKYPIHTHLIGSLLSQVQLERDGETITRTTVRDCVDILLRLQDPSIPGSSSGNRRSVYCTDFEPELLRRSGEFYETEAGEELERGDAAAYLRNVRPPSSGHHNCHDSFEKLKGYIADSCRSISDYHKNQIGQLIIYRP